MIRSPGFPEASTEKVFGAALFGNAGLITDREAYWYAENLLIEQENNPGLRPVVDELFARTDGDAFVDWLAKNPECIASSERDSLTTNQPITQTLRRMSLVGLVEFGRWHAGRYLEADSRLAQNKSIINEDLTRRAANLSSYGLLPEGAVTQMQRLSRALPPIKTFDSFYAARTHQARSMITEEAWWPTGPVTPVIRVANVFSQPSIAGSLSPIMPPIHHQAERLRTAFYGGGLSGKCSDRPTLGWAAEAMTEHMVQVADNYHLPMPDVVDPRERRRTQAAHGMPVEKISGYFASRYAAERTLVDVCMHPRGARMPFDLFVDAYNSAPESRPRAEIERRLRELFRETYPTWTEEPLYTFSAEYSRLGQPWGGSSDSRELVGKTTYDIIRREDSAA